jgi:putative ABC transport system permease protein
VGLSILLGAGGLVQSLRDSVHSYLNSSLGSDYVIMPSSLVLSSGNGGSGADLKKELESVPGVEMVTGMKSAQALSASKLAVQVLGISAADYPRVSGLNFLSGGKESYEKMKGGQIIVNGILAGTAGLKIGDSLELLTPLGKKSFVVSGVANDFINIKITSVYMDQGDFAQCFGPAPDLMNFVKLADGAHRAEAESGLRAALSLYPALTLYAGDTLKSTMVKMMDPAFAALYVFLLIFAIPSLVALVNCLVVSVLERTREFGVMRAVGALKEQLSRVVLRESLMLCFLSFVISLAGGVLLDRVMVAATSAKGFPVSFFWPVEGILVCLPVTLAIALIGSASPSRRVRRLEVIEALRYE